VWRELESYGQRRALRELQGLACRLELSDPQLAERTREAGRFIADR
jgi:hypothetical protein